MNRAVESCLPYPVGNLAQNPAKMFHPFSIRFHCGAHRRQTTPNVLRLRNKGWLGKPDGFSQKKMNCSTWNKHHANMPHGMSDTQKNLPTPFENDENPLPQG